MRPYLEQRVVRWNNMAIRLELRVVRQEFYVWLKWSYSMFDEAIRKGQLQAVRRSKVAGMMSYGMMVRKAVQQAVRKGEVVGKSESRTGKEKVV